MSKNVLLTNDGYNKLLEELEHLTSTRRREVAERIKTAIEFGDISENSEYDDAKNEQAFVEGRISRINSRNFSGFSDWSPSETASSGSSATSPTLMICPFDSRASSHSN